jgi:plastocyanin
MNRFTRTGAALVAVPLLALALLIGGCGGSGSTSGGEESGASGGKPAVAIVNYTYKPADLTVAAGTKISFTNHDTTPHTATSKESEAFETGPIDPGQTKSITLSKPGTYTYYCVFHPFMKGTLTVE